MKLQLLDAIAIAIAIAIALHPTCLPFYLPLSLLGQGLPQAHILANRMRKLRLAECLLGISVQEAPIAQVPGVEGGFGRVYTVALQFYQ